ncbi:MAG: YggS family pyridoxal phosphate-dependent enzyme [Thermoanaerobaculales bacterium]
MSVAENLAHVRERIDAACRRVGRDPKEVRIVAVSKTQPAPAVGEAIGAGVDAIGENRVQEAAAKRPSVRGSAPWHLVGPLQRNKAKAALELFDLIETIDRAELADRLELLLAAQSRSFPVYLEVNVGGEAQKPGVMPTAAAALAAHVHEQCPHLHLEGLMTVPPYDPDPERSRPYFAALRKLATMLASRYGIPRLELSMGMSEDYEVAVEEGASWVRLGRVLFGPRRSSS